jgi:4-hydroxy-3-polyprenylbenzoate decarboxylase
VVIGQDPLLFLFASKEMKYGESEYDFAGWIKGKPIEVLEGKNGLMIPARAEIVAEGYCYPGEEMEEGPFGEWTGYYSRPKQNTATIKVTRLLYRNNPIILGSPPSKPPNQVSLFNDILRSALIWDELDGAGIPGIHDICCHEAGGARFFVVISIRQKYSGHAKQVAAVAAQCHAAAYMGRYIVVVDDDIDAASLEDVIWAISTRSDPETDIDILRHCWTGPLDPIMDEKGYSARALIEATIPFKRRGSFPFVAKISPELANKTIAKWGAVLGDTQA